jgi:hypothetical protein
VRKDIEKRKNERARKYVRKDTEKRKKKPEEGKW